MRNIREVLRKKIVVGLSNRSIAKSCSIARSSVSKYLERAKEAGLTWLKIEEMSDEELELIVDHKKAAKEAHAMPDWSYIHKELKKKSVTLQLLWDEYKSENTNGYQYSQFCQNYQNWRLVLDLPMHQEHKAGEKMFVDYCGQTMPVTDKQSGEIHQAEIFVRCWEQAIIHMQKHSGVKVCRNGLPLMSMHFNFSEEFRIRSFQII